MNESDFSRAEQRLLAQGWTKDTGGNWTAPKGRRNDLGAGGSEYGNARNTEGASNRMDSSPPTRIRQSKKPLMNKLEAEWFEIIRREFPNYPRPRPQAKTYRLANGVRLTPDFTASLWPSETGPATETAWEVKGPHAWEDSLIKLKMAAHEWPEVQWILAWKQDGKWQTQQILP